MSSLLEMPDLRGRFHFSGTEKGNIYRGWDNVGKWAMAHEHWRGEISQDFSVARRIVHVNVPKNEDSIRQCEELKSFLAHALRLNRW